MVDGDKNKVARERHSAIRALWADPAWTTFAKTALLFLLDHDDTFASRLLSERNIRHPLRLPRAVQHPRRRLSK
ncbi:hypothetical protein [Geodermatophilus obscurus]|uniref:hypothetical protein n=1 Tax=Geodermatophilus obscurus TaxID=1861 RepID=UPI0011607718|nr:hypothetical protein [Geodermatophilus obscurus]